METMRTYIQTIVGFLAGGLLVFGLAGCSGEDEPENGNAGGFGEQVFAVTVGEVEQGAITETAPLIGSTRFGLRTLIKSEAGGRTLELAVREGERFKKGDLLVRIDDGDYRTDLLQEQAELDRAVRMLEELRAGTRQEVIDQLAAAVDEANAQLDLAEDDLRRSEKLFKEQVRTEAELARDRAAVATAKAVLAQDEARLAEARKGTRIEEIRVAEAEVAVHEARLEAIKRDLAKCVITAPYNGVVLRRYTDLGNYLEEGNDVMEIASMDYITALLEVPERFIRYLQPGMQFDVVSDALPDETFAVELIAVIPEADEQSRSLLIRCRVLEPRGKLLSGMFLRGRIPVVSRQNTTLIPQDAITLKDDKKMIFIVRNDTVDMEVATLGLIDLDKVELVQPQLSPGTLLVTTGGEILFPNAKVSYGKQDQQDQQAPSAEPEPETTEPSATDVE